MTELRQRDASERRESEGKNRTLETEGCGTRAADAGRMPALRK
jgi:hypothetical protein